ncbi:CapA family protein [Glutamicibacter protophormiae]|uniref:Poly-gamma-glutamate synthesis protein (Capsule biosynthesis protein) n=1 Tax=Glutamicibacter protophormiae TaxID=37930 RepID=A0ABS4XTA6_GLUPR|nr:CapA family protein [Glutamicibacter protophormiae]MBP2399731.1 poly-gamma-glutamate synthesis protein (capsule biosynthesis protein) [Glutamicibacter protophormiae]GGL88721.1 poly-gamma-glutamate biosynthesis protein [Glutamicibacter protophormiae]
MTIPLPIRFAALTASLMLPAALLSGCNASPNTQPSAVPPPSAAPELEATQPATSTDSPKETVNELPQELSLMVTGDVLLHPQLLDEAATAAGKTGGHGKDFDFKPLLAGLKPYVQDADAAICNLETPIGTPPYSGYPMFTVPSQIVSDLADIGYDGCTTATNHTVDAGTKGVMRTLETLAKHEMFSTGSYESEKDSKQPPIMDIKGVKLGVIATTYSLNGMSADTDWRVDTGVNPAKLIDRAKSARQGGADIVVAAVHEGAEYTNRPTEAQRKLGRALASSGEFDFIYMHHTHSVLPIEKYKGTWIVYGLGNSVAKHATPTILNREGISVKATFTRDGESWDVSKLQWVPHQLSKAPVTWCQVATSQTCVTEGDANASLERTLKTVDIYDAVEHGLEEWTLP